MTPEGMEGQASGGQAAAPSEQAPSAPETSSGQGSNNNSDYLRRLEEQNRHAQSKITEFGQQSAELKKQLDEMKRQDDLRKQQMLAAYGVKTQEAEPDVIDRMMQDPNYLENLLQDKIKQAVDPIRAERDRERLNASLQSEIAKKDQIRKKLSNDYSPEMIDQLTDFNKMFPDLAQQQAKLNEAYSYGSINDSEAQKVADAIDTELYKRIKFYGGLEGVVEKQIGHMMTNSQDLIQDRMKQERQRQILAQRNRPFGSFSGGATGDDLNSSVGYRRRVGAARVVTRDN